MTVSAGDAHPEPIYGARYRITVPILDADGDLVTGAAGLDSERSLDSGTFADCTNEATEIATSSGMYYLDLTSAEMTSKCTAGMVKTSTSGAKTTPFTLYPKRLPVLRTGTAQAGGATSITLDASANDTDDFYNGCYVNITNDLPSNALGQARKIVDYVGSTKVATVEAAWGTNPSSSSTFEILGTAESVLANGAAGATGGLATHDDVAGDGIMIEFSGPIVNEGDILQIVQGDDYTDDRAIVVTVTGEGVGAMNVDAWKLWLNTRGADPQQVTGVAVTIDATTLEITFETPKAITSELKATTGLWGLERTPTATTLEFNPKRGKLVVLPDVAVRQS